MLVFHKLEQGSDFLAAFRHTFALAAAVPFAMAGVLWVARR
jgi:hypothetical protein